MDRQTLNQAVIKTLSFAIILACALGVLILLPVIIMMVAGAVSIFVGTTELSMAGVIYAGWAVFALLALSFCVVQSARNTQEPRWRVILGVSLVFGFVWIISQMIWWPGGG